METHDESIKKDVNTFLGEEVPISEACPDKAENQLQVSSGKSIKLPDDYEDMDFGINDFTIVGPTLFFKIESGMITWKEFVDEVYRQMHEKKIDPNSYISDIDLWHVVHRDEIVVTGFIDDAGNHKISIT